MLLVRSREAIKITNKNNKLNMRKVNLLFLILCATTLSAQNVENDYKAMLGIVNYELDNFSKIVKEHPYWKGDYVLYKTNSRKIEAVPKSSATRTDYIYENEYTLDYSSAHEAVRILQTQIDSASKKIECMMELSSLETLSEEYADKRKLLDEIISYYETGKSDFLSTTPNADLGLGIISLSAPSIDVKIEKVKKDAAKGIVNKKFKKYIDEYTLSYINHLQKVVETEANAFARKMRESKQFKVITGVKDFTVPYYEMNGEKIINRNNVILLAKSGGDAWAKSLMRKMSEGWEWASYSTLKKTSQTFPVQVVYYESDEHPEYAVVYNNDLKDVLTQTQVFDKKGELVRINTVPTDYYGNISEQLEGEIYRTWFLENKYDIMSQSQKTINYVKEQLGLKKVTVTEAERKHLKDAMKAGNKVDNAQTYSQYKKAKQEQTIAAAKVFGDYMKSIDEIGENYIKQLKNDRHNLFAYIANLERVNDTTIDVYFISHDGKQMTRVRCNYYSVSPFKVKRDVNLVSISPANIDMDAIQEIYESLK